MKSYYLVAFATLSGLTRMTTSAAPPRVTSRGDANFDAPKLILDGMDHTGLVGKRTDIGETACHVVGGDSGNEYGAKEGTIKKGISHLRSLEGDCHPPPDQKRYRVSCSNNGGIWITNMGPGSFNIPWNEVADHAQNIIDHCSKYQNLVYWVMGTSQDKDNRFQVIVADTETFGESC